MDSQHEDLLVGAEHIHGSPRVASSLGAARRAGTQCLYAALLLLTSVYSALLLPTVAQVRLPVSVPPHTRDVALMGTYHELHWHGAAGSFWCPILSRFRACCFRDMRKGSETPMVKVLRTNRISPALPLLDTLSFLAAACPSCIHPAFCLHGSDTRDLVPVESHSVSLYDWLSSPNTVIFNFQGSFVL